MTQLIEIPFNAGMSEDSDPLLLPFGGFSSVSGMRLGKKGRLDPLPAYEALGTTIAGFGNSLKAYDIFAHGDARLLALGATTSALPPTNVYQFTGLSGKEWSPVGTPDSTPNTIQVPIVTDLRDMPRPPQQPSGVYSAHVAAGGGYVCVVWTSVADGFVYAYVFRASDGVQLVYTRLVAVVTSVPPRVLYVNDGFVVFTAVNADDISAYTFRPGTDTAFSGATVVLNDAAALANFEVANVSGAATNWVLVRANFGPDLRALRGTFSGGTVTVVTTIAIDAVNQYSGTTICADNTDAAIVVAARRTSNNRVTLWTYPLTGGAATAGPTLDIFNVAARGDTYPFAGYLQLGSSYVGTGVASRIEIAESVPVDAATTPTGQPAVYITQRIPITHAQDFLRGVQGVTMHSGFLSVVYYNLTPQVFFGALVDKPMLGTTPVARSNALIQMWMGPDRSFTAALKDVNLGGQQTTFSTSMMGNIAVDISTGLYYWCHFLRDPVLTTVIPNVTEFRIQTSARRRQSAELDGQLLISGGRCFSYDGGPTLTDPGFEQPDIRIDAVSNGAGALTNNATYNYCAIWTWTDGHGRKHRSPVSLIQTRTLGATDDTVDLSVSVPHSLRNAGQNTLLGSSPQIELYRTVASGGIPGATFHLTLTANVPLTGTYGARVQVTDLTSDAALAFQPILYTQSQTPLEHHAPPPFRYIAAGRSRVILGGLPDETAVSFSKLTFPGEPVEFAAAGQLAFTKSIGEPVTAVMALDDSFIVASKRALYSISGAGPDHSGLGEFTEPARIPGLGGIEDWRSVVETPQGYFFLSASARLFFVDRSGAISWTTGRVVQDTLVAFPEVTSAAYCRKMGCVVFSCVDTNSASRLLFYDVHNSAWYVQTPTADGFSGFVVKVLEANGGLLHLLSSTGTVYRERTGTADADMSAGFAVTTGSVKFNTAGGWGKIYKISVRGVSLSTSAQLAVSVTGEGDVSVRSQGNRNPTTPGAFFKTFVVDEPKQSVVTISVTGRYVQLQALVLEVEGKPGVNRRPAGDKG